MKIINSTKEALILRAGDLFILDPNGECTFLKAWKVIKKERNILLLKVLSNGDTYRWKLPEHNRCIHQPLWLLSEQEYKLIKLLVKETR